jgi:hypothetical protein
MFWKILFQLNFGGCGGGGEGAGGLGGWGGGPGGLGGGPGGRLWLISKSGGPLGYIGYCGMVDAPLYRIFSRFFDNRLYIILCRNAIVWQFIS